MSERTFFDQRYTTPGYVFILLLLIINLGLLKNLFQMENIPNLAVTIIGLLLGFILSGPAIGFLVSQLWYLLSQTIFRSRVYLSNSVSKVLTEECEVEDDDDILITISDHISHTYKNEEIRRYQERRWDLLNLMGSVCVTILLGLALGYAIRWLQCSAIAWLACSKFNPWFDGFVIVCSVVLCVIVSLGARQAIKEHQSMLVLIIRSKLKELKELKKERKKLRDLYPGAYFKSNSS